MRFRVLAMLLVSGSIAEASTTQVRLPAGATQFVTAPVAQEASKAFAPLLANTVTWSVSLSHGSVNLDLAQQTGFRLLDADHLRANGVDVAKDWALFDHAGAQYLGLFLSREKLFDEAVSRWAGRRGLMSRTERLHEGVRMVTWSRSKGSRPAAGYARKGDIAVVLLDASTRSDTLESAWRAWDSAAPVKAPEAGSLHVWTSSWRGAKDVWVTIVPRADGLDAKGSARQASDWFRRDASRSGWITSATAEGGSDLPLRLRTTPKSKAFEALQGLLSPLFGKTVTEELPLASAKAVEVLSLAVDAQALKRSTKDGALDTGGVLSPRLRLHLDGPAKNLKGSSLKVTSEPTGVVAQPLSSSQVIEAPAGTGQGMECSGSTAVAAARLDVAGISRALLPVGLLSAMSNDVLLGVFGVNAEYGHLLRASRPVTALVCENAKGRISYEARWRFTPRVR